MKLILYNTNCSQNEIPKTFTEVLTENITLRQETNILTPVLVLTKQETIDYNRVNYAKLENRYYFVNILQRGNNALIYMQLTEDVLQTYLNDVLNLTVDVTSTQKLTNNSTVPTSKETETFKYTSDTELPQTENIILQTVGTNSKTNNTDTEESGD